MLQDLTGRWRKASANKRIDYIVWASMFLYYFVAVGLAIWNVVEHPYAGPGASGQEIVLIGTVGFIGFMFAIACGFITGMGCWLLLQVYRLTKHSLKGGLDIVY